MDATTVSLTANRPLARDALNNVTLRATNAGRQLVTNSQLYKQLGARPAALTPAGGETRGTTAATTLTEIFVW